MAGLPEALEQYPIYPKEKGLFVIITQLTHKVNFTPNPKKDYDWGTRKKLHYEKDEELIMKVFHLDEKHGNVIKDRDLINGKGRKSFDKFMENVCARRTERWQFVMVFLMSHGFENGDFLLACSGEEVSGEIESKEQCCTKRSENTHALTGNCHGRNFVEDVMKKVCDNFAEEIPKVFVNQTCRGAGSDLVHSGNSDPDICLEPSETELFIPPTLHNAFLLWACVSGSTSQVASTGSFLIQELGKALNELKSADESFRSFIRAVQARSDEPVAQNHDQATISQAIECVEKKREHCTGGWIMNVCQRATALVTNKMLVEVVLPSSTKLGQLLSKSFHEISNCSPQKFVSALRQHKSTTKRKKMVQKVIDKCTARIFRKWSSWTARCYLWYNVRGYHPKYHLEGISKESERLDLEEALDGIIEEVSRTKPNSKQQPHISSSLYKKLSLTKILQTQSAIAADI